jgi:hypothetical protein
MLFEEFFKKKKISLEALQQGNPGLFFEFKNHYEQMGEKSFDHTKKFWFNKLRHQYPLPPEVKAEKLRAENQIAEQTVSDTLTEPSPRAEAPKLGFKPKFKTTAQQSTGAGDNAAPVQPAPGQPVENNTSPTGTPATETNAAETPAATPAKIGFKPRFKAGGVTSSQTTNETAGSNLANQANTDTPQEQPVPEPAATPAKMGFKPRFKAGVTTSKPDPEPAPAMPDSPSATEPAIEAETEKQVEPAKLGFKPRFKAGVTTTQPADARPEPTEASETQQSSQADEQAAQAVTPESPNPAPKLGFKPRFKTGVTTTQPQSRPAENSDNTVLPVQPESPPSPDSPVSEEEKPAPAKPAYKPRFNPKMVKPKPPQEGEA